jgi:hypothetical protein
MSRSTGSGSSPRIPYGPAMRCGCVTKDVSASWSFSGSSPSGPAHRLPSNVISTIALPRRLARSRSRWLSATAARAVRPSASAGVSRSCSGGQPAEPVPALRHRDGFTPARKRRGSPRSVSGCDAERFGMGPAVVFGKGFTESAGTVRHSAVADLTAGDRKLGNRYRETARR